MDERVDPRLDADTVGRGYEFAVGDEAELVGTRDDPLGIGGGDFMAEEDDAGSESERIVELLAGVLWAKLNDTRALPEPGSPGRIVGEQAPVVGGADGINSIEMGTGIGRVVGYAVAKVAARDHGGDAHVEVGVGLGLGVHAGEAVDKSWDDEFT